MHTLGVLVPWDHASVACWKCVPAAAALSKLADDASAGLLTTSTPGCPFMPPVNAKLCTFAPSVWIVVRAAQHERP